MDFEMGSRGAGIQFLSQSPHEAELVFPPLTTLSTHRVVQCGAKRCVVCSVDVSTAGPDTTEIVEPTDVPGTAPAQRWLAEQLELPPPPIPPLVPPPVAPPPVDDVPSDGGRSRLRGIAKQLAQLAACDMKGRSCAGGGAAHLALLVGRARHTLPMLSALNLHGCDLLTDDARVIMAGLRLSETITTLDLSSNAKLGLVADQPSNSPPTPGCR